MKEDISDYEDFLYNNLGKIYLDDYEYDYDDWYDPFEYFDDDQRDMFDCLYEMFQNVSFLGGSETESSSALVIGIEGVGFIICEKSDHACHMDKWDDDSYDDETPSVKCRGNVHGSGHTIFHALENYLQNLLKVASPEEADGIKMVLGRTRDITYRLPDSAGLFHDRVESDYDGDSIVRALRRLSLLENP